jgi:hypothetical protein
MTQPDVSWLGSSYPPAEGTTTRTDVRDRLIELGVLSTEEERKKVGLTTPESVQVISAGSTALTKWWATIGAAGLGGSALVQGLKSLNWLPGKDVAGGQQVALTLSAALLASTAAIAIAVIVRGDVLGRATASAAEYAARASITHSLVKAFTYAAPPAVTVAAPPQHVVRTTRGTWHAVREFAWDQGRLVAVVSDTVSVPVDEMDWVTKLEVPEG